jgi:hypothetical protein
MSIATFPDRPFARFLKIEECVWDDTGYVWVVYLTSENADWRELGSGLL